MRRVGVEIELAGLSAEQMILLLQERFGGWHEQETVFEHRLRDSQLGTFKVELDAKYLKDIARTLVEERETIEALALERLELASTELLTRAAENFVPWEIVSPPIPMDALSRFNEIIPVLREAGGLGTHHALQYAFGLHLNPELPDLDAETIVRYLRAYVCLYEWIIAQEPPDLLRRLSPYIRHFDKGYMLHLLDPAYQPDLDQLIDDYLLWNPTRNRSLDLLPLFCHLDQARVRAVIDDVRVKARPTLHYRLPNCDLDNPRWSLYNAWQPWLAVETLAGHADLPTLARHYHRELQRLTHVIDSAWVDYLEVQVIPELEPA
jgi:hypothetical protein